MSVRQASSRAFSLIELVIVVVIIGIIAAIAVPRMSRGAQGAADSSVISSLQVFRNALDLYQTEHGGTYPTVANFSDQMLKYSNEAGTTSADSKDATNYLGPYLRSIPALPVGPRKGSTGVAAADAAGIGWLYTVTNGVGDIRANAAGTKDSKGVDYATY
ncbi:MAG TPA: prepilin-type N-terminal cleavage/methylation domain-containing protein [Phycisphaerales bacterium]|nr:prepilin-type N-terminal cleavage/methylation domain-containing protein [Phycisphaerales bacterium]